MVSNTGWTLVGELEITRRISPVAVCCSRVSVRSWLRSCTSVNRRTFWIAITAWSAKVSSKAIWLSENGRGVLREEDHPDDGPSRNIGTPSTARNRQ